MPLIDPLPPEASPEVAELARFFDETLGFRPNSILTMQRRPEIAAAFIALNKAVMNNAGRVTSEQKRLIGHVASLTAGCRYCQAHTILAAERYGGSDARLAAVWDYARSDLFSEAEKAALDLAVAASAVPNAVDDAVKARMLAWWTPEEIVEILSVIALFGFLNRWNDSMGTTLEPPAEETARRHLGPSGWRTGKHV